MGVGLLENCYPAFHQKVFNCDNHLIAFEELLHKATKTHPVYVEFRLFVWKRSTANRKSLLFFFMWHRLSVTLNLFVFHTRSTTQIKSKNSPRTLLSDTGGNQREGECQPLSHWDGYRLSVIKAFVVLPNYKQQIQLWQKMPHQSYWLCIDCNSNEAQVDG